MGILAGLLSGLFGGIGSVALLELWLRPRLDRKQIAAVLASEIELNEERLLVTQMVGEADSTRVLRHVHISTVALDSYRHRLASLEPEALRHVMRLYWELDRVQTTAHSASDHWELYNKADDGSPERTKRRRMINEALEVFDASIDAALLVSGQLRVVLYDLARLKPSLRLSRGDLSERARTALAVFLRPEGRPPTG